MQPTTPTRFPDEVERQELAEELEHCLGPLSEYCDAQETAPHLSDADRRLLYQVTEFIAAVGRYDAATEALLASYRGALERAERPTTQPVPTLQASLLAQLSPADLLAHREADPVYRLGYMRGHQKGTADTEAVYERLTSFYAQYAIIVPPTTYQPSPLVARLTKWLAERVMSGPRLPLDTRRRLLNQTPTFLPLTA